MNSEQLIAQYHRSLTTLRELRSGAGFHEPNLEDCALLRADARRFAERLATAADAGTAEIIMLADHSGAQAFWFLLGTHWELMVTFLLPAGFELMPSPLPFEVLASCFLWSVDNEPLPLEAFSHGCGNDQPVGTYDEVGAEGFDTLAMAPLRNGRTVGAVWDFASMY